MPERKRFFSLRPSLRFIVIYECGDQLNRYNHCFFHISTVQESGTWNINRLMEGSGVGVYKVLMHADLSRVDGREDGVKYCTQSVTRSLGQ